MVRICQHTVPWLLLFAMVALQMIAQSLFLCRSSAGVIEPVSLQSVRQQCSWPHRSQMCVVSCRFPSSGRVHTRSCSVTNSRQS
jgi:hypothetical protein